MGTDYSRIDWGRTPPERRGRWGRWLRIKRDGDGQEAVVSMLGKMGRPIGASYYSEMETGKKPVNEDWRAVFIRAYGESADDWDDPWDKPVVTEDAALLSVLSEIRDELRLSRLASDRNADVLAQLLGVVLAGRLPTEETGTAGDAPVELGIPGL